MTLMFDSRRILLGEIRCLSLLGINGLRVGNSSKGSGGWTLSKKGKRKKERKGSSDGYAIVTIQV